MRSPHPLCFPTRCALVLALMPLSSGRPLPGHAPAATNERVRPQDEAEIRSLERKARSHKEQTALLAMAELGRLGARGAPGLAQVVSKGHDWAKAAALLQLAGMGADAHAALPAVLDLLEQAEPVASPTADMAAAALVFSAFGAQMVHAMGTDLSRKDERVLDRLRVRLHALSVLRTVGRADARGCLDRVHALGAGRAPLEGGYDDIGVALAQGLADEEGPGPDGLLALLVERTDPGDRAILLLAIGFQEQRATLCGKALRDLLGNEPDPGLRALAAEALGKVPATCADSGAVLRALLDDRTPRVRLAAALSLERLCGCDPASTEALLSVLEQDPVLLQCGALVALAAHSRRAEPVLASLLERLSSRSDYVRLWALKATASLGTAGADAAPRIVELLEDDNEAVRRAAEEALRQVSGN